MANTSSTLPLPIFTVNFMNSEISTAEIAQVKVGAIEFQGLKFPDGSYGIAVPQIANLFSISVNHASRDFKALLGCDFQYIQAKTSLNPKAVKALTLYDFEKLTLELAFKKQNVVAESLVRALFGLSFHQLCDVQSKQGTRAIEKVADRFHLWCSNYPTKVKKTQKRKLKKTEKGFVYILVDNTNNAFKIGFTTNLESRLYAHKSSNPFLELVKVYDESSIYTESSVHRRLASYRIANTTEWYIKCPEVLKIVDLFFSSNSSYSS